MLQDEKNQVLTSEVWMNQVSTYSYCSKVKDFKWLLFKYNIGRPLSTLFDIMHCFNLHYSSIDIPICLVPFVFLSDQG